LAKFFVPVLISKKNLRSFLVKAIPILFAILGMTAFLHSLRWAQFRRVHIYAVAASNYIAASVIFIWWVIFSHVPMHSDVLIRGCAIGGLYGIAFFLLVYGLESIGVGKTSVIVNLAQAIPILASIIIWGERPGELLIIGIFGTAVAIPLVFLPENRVAWPEAQRGHVFRRIRLSVFLAMTGLYIAQGAAYTIMKSFERLDRPGEKPVLLAALFVTAAVLTTILLFLREWATRSKRSLPVADGNDLFHGVFTGLCNAVSNIALVAALTVAAGTVVFPTVTAGTIIAVTLLSILFWRERYRPLTWFGLALAVVSVILINL
jgi:drug/metabolite transporter (DMT)-like permease